MYNPINQLKCLAVSTACTVHDEEALSALELAGRTAAKVNECVKLVNDTCDKLDLNLKETLALTMADVMNELGVNTEALDKMIEEALGGAY